MIYFVYCTLRVPYSNHLHLNQFHQKGIKGKLGSGPAKEHWMDHAVGPVYSEKFVKDCKSLMKVVVLLLPMPIFWSLFEQQVCNAK